MQHLILNFAHVKKSKHKDLVHWEMGSVSIKKPYLYPMILSLMTIMFYKHTQEMYSLIFQN